MPYDREPEPKSPNHQITNSLNPLCQNPAMALIVLDLDGTLIDSRRDLADAANALIVERGGRPQPVDAIAGMVGEGAALLVRRAMTAAGLDAGDASALPRFLELYDERLLVHTQLYGGIRDALETLRGRATLSILTNKPQRATETILGGLDIAGYFRRVVGGDTSHGRKPDPAGLRFLMAEAGASAEETVMVGDSAIDLKTARAAGVQACLVRYGFGFWSVGDLLQPSDRVAESPGDLPLVTLAAGRG
jgi:phosphoglycolate phosphatase